MDKLSALRAKMAQRGIDAYIVPTADDHESEYVGEHYKARAYLTGFTGSAGVCAVTREDAALWTDGRYFIQAAREIAGSGFRLMKMGEPGVPTLAEYLRGALPGGGTLGFDGRVVNAALAQELAGAVEGARLCTDCDLVGEIWPERPPRSASAAFLLPLERAGIRHWVKPSRRTSDRRCPKAFTERSSPVRPTSPMAARLLGTGLSRKLEARAMIMARSAAGSSRNRPPITLI